MGDILKVIDVSKEFVGHKALDSVSMSVGKGKIYGLLGPNGAGKTTLLRIIHHITAPDAGVVEFDGHRLTASDVASIGYLPEERGLYRKMKVGEQALFFARLKGMSKREAESQIDRWFRRFGIENWLNKKVEELSKGMAQKVQFIITVLHNPRLLIFDEPFSGFDPINAHLLKGEILRLRDEGASIIFSTHNMESVEQLCDDFTLINKGRNILSGNVMAVRKEMGANRYQFVFEGDADRLVDAFGRRIAESVDMTDDDPPMPSHDSSESSIVVKFRPDVSVKEIVEIANSTVTLKSFSENIPSMDEIFIRAIERSSQRRSADKQESDEVTERKSE